MFARFLEQWSGAISVGAAALLTLCVLTSWLIHSYQLRKLWKQLRASTHLMEQQSRVLSLLCKRLEGLSDVFSEHGRTESEPPQNSRETIESGLNPSVDMAQLREEIEALQAEIDASKSGMSEN